MGKLKIIADFNFLEHPEEVGTLYIDNLKAKESYSFEFAKSRLAKHSDIQLSADIDNFPGRQYPRHDGIFACFTDCMPDRWGRTLLREQFRHENLGATHNPNTSDYLIGVCDKTRMGAFRFLDEQGHYVGMTDGKNAVPPVTDIQELMELSSKVEQNGIKRIPTEDRILRRLVRPGSSAGGARPKAVVGDSGNLFIAKFPSVKDDCDVARLEHFAHLMACECGIEVAETKLIKFGNYSTLLSKRFDRKGDIRIHMASSMTLAGLADGCGAETGNGYLDIVDAICRYSSDSENDLKELYRRVTFNICIGNVDDHFRNHAFLLTPKGWKLSPVYDVNPTSSRLHALLIDRYTNEGSLDILYDAHEDYCLSDNDANIIIKDVLRNMKYWESTARNLNLDLQDMAALKTRIDEGMDYRFSGGLHR